MKKGIFIFISGIVIGILLSHLMPGTVSKKWIPVLEDTSFTYLDDSIDYIISDINEAGKELEDGDAADVKNSLEHTMRDILKLKQYYIPMTSVRQYVYDSERLFMLDKT